jgi:uncharacterized YigZ family protein
MLFSDIYHEPAHPAESSLREKGSKFISYGFPVKSDEEIKQNLNELKKRYPDATHHCYAWILNPDKSAQRANDDGEPNNSAGKPILRAILSADLTNVLVVVVRYFGGTQLGIPGLIQAYGESAAAALEKMGRQEKFIEDHFQISAAFEHEQEIHRLINKFQATVNKRDYKDKVYYNVSIKQRLSKSFEVMVKENYLLEAKIL